MRLGLCNRGGNPAGTGNSRYSNRANRLHQSFYKFRFFLFKGTLCPVRFSIRSMVSVRTLLSVWLMRQAGRYLPEYRELRAEKGGFLELVYDSEAAAEITVQPIRRFGFDWRDPVFRYS